MKSTFWISKNTKKKVKYCKANCKPSPGVWHHSVLKNSAVASSRNSILVCSSIFCFFVELKHRFQILSESSLKTQPRKQIIDD